MKTKKYLYYESKLLGYYVRCLITKETRFYYWIFDTASIEKVSKRTMHKRLPGWEGVFRVYKTETPEILESYAKCVLRLAFNNTLKFLLDCKDENIMKQVVSLDLCNKNKKEIE